MNCKPSNSCCSPTQQWKEILLNTQDKAIQAYNLAQQALDEIENLPAGGGSVQSVNGELPDQDGNVTVDTGVVSVNGDLPDADGDVTIDTGVLTVNGVSADADGEITITAGSNITITPDADTNSIEISAEGGSPEAVAPIYIDQDGKIALKGWSLVTTYDWTQFIDSNRCATEDLLLYIYDGNAWDDILICKGQPLERTGLNASRATGNNITYAWNKTAYELLNTTGATTAYVLIMAGAESNYSGADQVLSIIYYTQSASLTKIIDPSDLSNQGVRLYRRS